MGFDRYVAPLDVASFGKTLPEGRHNLNTSRRRTCAEISDNGHRRLLRAGIPRHPHVLRGQARAELDVIQIRLWFDDRGSALLREARDDLEPDRGGSRGGSAAGGGIGKPQTVAGLLFAEAGFWAAWANAEVEPTAASSAADASVRTNFFCIRGFRNTLVYRIF